MRILYKGDKELLSEIPDRKQRSVYILLKYWIDRPKKWNKIWRRLSDIYKNDSKWEYLITNTLKDNGLDWIGEYIIDENTGNEYIKDPTRTWIISDLGKKHIEDDFFKLGYKKSVWQRVYPWLQITQAATSIAAIIISIIALSIPNIDESEESTNQEIVRLKKELESTLQEVSKIRLQTDSLNSRLKTLENYE